MRKWAMGRPGPAFLSRFYAVSLTVFGVMAMASWPALAQEAIDPEADRVLKAMTDTLKALPALSADYDVDHEIVSLEGQKIQYSASGSIALDRAKGLRVTRKGPFADAEMIFDGKTISLHGRGVNVYAQIESLGPSVEEAIAELRASTGLDAPGADLLAGDPYAALTEGATEGVVVGSAFIGGVECDHLAFRTDVVDWQIWISKGDTPLPLKYVITTKWVTGAPEYSLRLSNWRTDGIDAGQFAFTPPADARKVEQVYADVTGELSLESGK